MTWLLRTVWLSCSFIAVNSYAQEAPAPTTDSQATTAVRPGVTTNNFYLPLQAKASPIRVERISPQVREQLGVSPFYTKYLIVRGLPVVSSDKASDYALLECAYTLDHMFANSPGWVLSALTNGKARMSVMSSREYTMDLPENLEWQTDRSPEKMAYWDERARGMGGLPDASCAEENLLNLSSDPYRSENITIHEFSHTLASALEKDKPEWYKRLVSIYKDAMDKGRFAHTYSASNEQEYWAEGVQMWFDCAVQKADASVHNGIWNREQLKIYDPALAQIVAEVFGNGTWRYTRSDGRALVVNGKTYTRPLDEKRHLAGLDRSQIPAFNLADSPRIQALKAQQTTTSP